MTILDDLRAVMETIENAKPLTYYVLNDAVTPGKVLICNATHGFPEVWHFHPDDFAANKKELARYCRLVDFREWTPTSTDIEQAFLDVLKRNI